MKTKHLFYSVAATLMLCATPFLSACSDDDDNPIPAGDPATLKVHYEVDFPDDIYNFCDVWIEYTDQHGNTATATLTNDFEKVLIVPIGQANNEYKVAAHVNIKKNYPPVYDSAIYNVGHEVEVKITEFDSEGKQLNFSTSQDEYELTVPGNKLVEFINSNPYFLANLNYPF